MSNTLQQLSFPQVGVEIDQDVFIGSHRSHVDVRPRVDDRHRVEDHVKMDKRVDKARFIGAQDMP